MRAARLPVLLLLAVWLAGCGAVDEPRPRPPGPDVPPVERLGALKTANWDAAAAAAAARAARLRAAIRRMRRSRTVAGALRLALLTRRLTDAQHARLTREYAAARATAARLGGVRGAEITAVLGIVDRLAAERRLTASRLPAAFLVLRRNTEFWRTAAMPAAGGRTSFKGHPAVFQYYPGRGLQLQPLASWGKVNWTAKACLRRRAACATGRLERSVDALLALASRRGGFLAWEHYFDWGGGYAPWISGMTQATAISALARSARVLGKRRYARAARRALGAFRAPPPVGVSGGDHFLMYSFAPDLRIFNGELQAVNGIGELAALTGDRQARRLFRLSERAIRRTVAAFDTGAWSLYSTAGRESSLSYHQLVGRFLGDMCARTERRTYCDARERFARYEREPTRIGIAPLRDLHARRATTVRFSISKMSHVRVRLWSERGLSLSRDLDLTRGEHSLPWTPAARGDYRLRIDAQGPSGPLGVEQRRFKIVLPKPPPRCRPKPRRAERRDARRSAGETESRCRPPRKRPSGAGEARG